MQRCLSYSDNQPTIQQYKIFGLCTAEVEVDILTGQNQITRVDILEDVGNSMSPLIDIGQVEGAFVMGILVVFSIFSGMIVFLFRNWILHL